MLLHLAALWVVLSLIPTSLAGGGSRPLPEKSRHKSRESSGSGNAGPSLSSIARNLSDRVSGGTSGSHLASSSKLPKTPTSSPRSLSPVQEIRRVSTPPDAEARHKHRDRSPSPIGAALTPPGSPMQTSSRERSPRPSASSPEAPSRKLPQLKTRLDRERLRSPSPPPVDTARSGGGRLATKWSDPEAGPSGHFDLTRAPLRRSMEPEDFGKRSASRARKPRSAEAKVKASADEHLHRMMESVQRREDMRRNPRYAEGTMSSSGGSGSERGAGTSRGKSVSPPKEVREASSTAEAGSSGKHRDEFMPAPVATGVEASRAAHRSERRKAKVEESTPGPRKTDRQKERASGTSGASSGGPGPSSSSHRRRRTRTVSPAITGHANMNTAEFEEERRKGQILAERLEEMKKSDPFAQPGIKTPFG